MAPRSSRAAVWVLLAGLIGFTASYVFSSILRLGRPAFIGAYAVLAAGFVAAYVRWEAVSPGTQIRRRWLAGLVGGILVGALLVRTVLAQPSSARPAGGALWIAFLWEGLVYGSLDAVLLSVIPVLVVYGSRPVRALERAENRWLWGLLALAASSLVTALYHLGFAEYRGSSLGGPLVGNAIITLGYLMTGNPLAAIIAHVSMHGAAVWHGAESTVQLPPHY